ncbi:sacsin-like, partial [Pocillopora damicornis]|uniref:sacsin-like n=1 Tax=Pocillopora damicornis TaxID=46731 RepID=UPI000F55164F
MDECLRRHASNRSNQLLDLYEYLLSNNRCIPCGPDKGHLAFPKELISPKGSAATLFSEDDRRFPVGSCYQTKERLLMLQNLGMLSDILDWETLIERANSVSVLCRRAEQDARKRSALLIKYINVHLEKMDHPTELNREELMEISMFPTLAKPANYVMPWKGTADWNSVILPAKEMYGDRYKFIAGSSRPILDESESGCSRLSKKTRHLFGFSSRKPSAHEVLSQLEHAVQAMVQSPHAIESLEQVFHCIYDYLQELVQKPDGERIVHALEEKRWILVQGKCLSASRLAFAWKGFGEPYLNEVPQNLATKYRRLFQATGIKEHFSTEDVISALYELDEEKQGERLSTKEPGRIFCFLPLPPDADSKTGLPVHVHGYFGLTDNRRGLKWPGLDCQDDPTAEWNVSLVQHVASEAYANVLLLVRDSCDSSVGADLVYKSWPNIQKVEIHWQCMLEHMFSILLKENIFWTPAHHGQWKNLSDAYLDRMTTQFQNTSDETRRAVLDTLTQANEAVVIVPSHVMIAIDKYTSIFTKSITPTFLRALLKKKEKGVWKITNVPKEKKLLLLEFSLADKNLSDMRGVPLLPLANGSFVDFRSIQYNREPAAAVYVSSTNIPRSIFHNMDSKFLDDNVKTPAITYLSKVATDAESPNTIQPVQLVKLNQAKTLKLLREMLPSEWYRGNHPVPWYPGRNGHPPERWLESVWKWIQKMFSDLSLLENLPLIPHTCAGNRSIVKLSSSRVVIRRHYQSVCLPPLIVSLLGKTGCIVLENLPSYIHHNTLHRYVASPDPNGVLKVLSTLDQSRCVSMITHCSSDEKQALRSFLSFASSSVDQRNLLYNLPIFDAADGYSFIALINGFQVHGVLPYDFKLPQSLPIPRASSVITLRDSESHT